MSQVESKTEKQHRKCMFGSSKRLALFRYAVFVLIAGMFAFSQQLPKSGFDVEARSREIVAHLNAVIQFYRTAQQPIQKAGEPNDVVYRDQAIALSSQVAGFAFQSAKAEGALMSAYQTSKEAASGSSATGEQQKMQAVEENVERQIDDLQTRRSAVEQQLATASRAMLLRYKPRKSSSRAP